MIQSHHFRPRCLSELTRKPRAPVISESDDEDPDDTIPPLLPPMPPLSELKRKPSAPVISGSDDEDQDDTVPPLNAFEGFTTSTPVLKGGFFPEFFPGTSLNNLLSPIQTEPPSTQPRKRRNNAAQDLMFCRRQKQVKWSSYQDAITVEDYKLKEPIQLLKLWLPELNLAKSDQDILLNPAAWLADSLIDAAQTLLKKANPAMQGL